MLATVSGTGPTDAALVVAASAGETWAQEALFRRHAPRLIGLAFRIMGRDDEVEDIVQDAFVEGLESLDSLRRIDAFASWIGTIVVRQARRRIRRRRLLARLGLATATPVRPDDLVSPNASPERALELRGIYGAFDEMSAEVRLAVVLHRIEGLGLAETSAALGLSVATVKRRIQEAEALLRRRVSIGGIDD